MSQISNGFKCANSDQSMALLKLINGTLKTPDGFSQAFETLCEIEPDDIESPGSAMYYFYLIHKGYRMRFDQRLEQDDLRMAASAIAKTFSIAYEYKVGVRNPKFHFARCSTYLKLASCESKVNETYYRKAYYALRKAWKHRSPSIEWIHDQIKEFAGKHQLEFSPMTTVES